MEIFEKLKNIFSNGKNKGESDSNNLIRNLIIMGAIGFIFLFAGNFFSIPDQPPGDKKIVQKNQEDLKKNDYQTDLENKLAETISFIKGVGNVKVQLIISQTSVYQYEYNEKVKNKITNETDRNGGERQIEEESSEKEMIIIKDADGKEKPVIKTEKKPVITGVLIIAEGAENSDIKYEIYKAVSSLLDLPVHRLSVLPYHKGGK